MKPGETVTLSSLLEGFENCTSVRFQWECSRGGAFEPVPGATDSSYSFEASSESLSWSWRLLVSFEEN